MDIKGIKEEINKTKRKLEILNSIHCIERASDMALLNEMKVEYNKRLEELIKEEKRLEDKDKKKTKVEHLVYKCVLIGGGIVSLFIFILLINRQNLNFIKDERFLYGILVFYILFSFINIYVLADKKLKYGMAIIFVVCGITFFSKIFFKKDVFHIVDKSYLPFALSLISFIDCYRKRDE